MAATVFNVTLHHLAPGAHEAGLAFPNLELAEVNVAQLRDLLLAFETVASHLTIYEPSTPEVRIRTEQNTYVVRTRYRQLCFVGYETTLRGEDHSLPFILSTITGTAEPLGPGVKLERRAATRPAEPGGFILPHAPAAPVTGRPRWVKLASLAALVLIFNLITAWLVLRPTPTFAPEHQFLTDDASRALLAKVAGDYQTGTQEGDRRLAIAPDGRLRLAKYGPQRAVVEERTKTVRGALVNGRPALLTNDPYVLELKDADTVVLYGTTYRRTTEDTAN